MITLACLKNVLEMEGFSNNGNKYIYMFDNGEKIEVDFQKKEIHYPENSVSRDRIDAGEKADGIIINDHTTTNFSHPENFVVLICVYRLLKQGYRAQDIELEPKWPLGREAKGGKADILIKDNDGYALVIIECKTAQEEKRNEFEKEWSNMLRSAKNQLFSYFQQRPDSKYLCLYTADYVDEKVLPEYYLINVQDNDEYLKQCKTIGNKSIKGFKEADTAKQKWEAWKQTYSSDFATKGLFEDSTAYIIGKSKYTFEDLEPISSVDISKKFHKYASILRMFTVSNRENAFNILSNLFLCKVVDEMQLEQGIKDELEFYWKGKQYDSPFELIDRLQKLYSEGMKEFLKDEVAYVEQKEIDEAFELRLKGKAKEKIDSLFRKLKYFTNNDFAFVDVYNEKLFYNNFNILLQVVIMLQDIYVTKSEDNQFLGDFYELFLGAGVHQSEGQFFTPTPVTNFIVRSLPKRETARVIDFACGAGHFLTEYARYNEGETYELTGIDKDNRLSKLTKIASFMYGQNIKVVYADALSDLSKYGIYNHEYDCIIANPPFSVKGFLDTLLPDERNNYHLFNGIDEKNMLTNDSIECFFLERASQLLDKDGILGIILPAGILDNGGVDYETRKILLREFEIISIVSMNKITFGTTGTKAVILFARRKEFLDKSGTNFCISEYYDDIISQYSKNEKLEKIDEEFEKSKELRESFCEYMGYSIVEFESLYNGALLNGADILSFECFEEYREEYDKKTESEKNIYNERINKEKVKWSNRSEKYRKEHPWVEPEEYVPGISFEQYVMPYELEKFRYWLYTHNTEVLVIKSPEKKVDGKSNKASITSFLGYEWKKRKTKEGIHYLSQISESIDEELDEEDQAAIANINSINYIQTPLYNPQDREDPEKLCFLIRKKFENEEFEIPSIYLDESGRNTNVSLVSLVDMLNFEKPVFDASITIGNKNKLVHFKSDYEIKSINKLCKKVFAGGDKPNDFVEDENSDYCVPVIGNGTNNEGILGYTKTARVTEKCVTLSARGTVGYSFLRETPFTPIVRLIVMVCNENLIYPEYLDFFLKAFNIGNTGSVIPQLTVPYVKKVKIPQPPKPIQDSIIAKCQVIKTNFNERKMTEIEYFKELKKVFVDNRIVII